MHLQSCNFAHKTYCFFDVTVAAAVVVSSGTAEEGLNYITSILMANIKEDTTTYFIKRILTTFNRCRSFCRSKLAYSANDKSVL